MVRHTEAVPVTALNRTRSMLYRAHTLEEASLEAQRPLASMGMAALPEQGLLPIAFLPPRRRRDGDWLLGALKRYHAVLQETDNLLIRTQETIDEIYATLPRLREDAGAHTLVAAATGRPVITLSTAESLLNTSQKSALKAIDLLETNQVLMEIRGTKKWRAWVLHERFGDLGFSLAA